MKEGQGEVARKIMAKGFDDEQINEITRLTQEELKEIRQRL